MGFFQKLVGMLSSFCSQKLELLLRHLSVIKDLQRPGRDHKVTLNVDFSTTGSHNQLSGKKSKSVFDFLTYSRETGFSFS